MLPVHSSLAVRSPRTTNLAVMLALCFCCCCYIGAGVLGMLTFSSHAIQPNILRSYGNVVLVDVARVSIALAVSSLYPLLVFTARGALMIMLQRAKLPAWLTPSRVFFSLTVLLLVLTYLVASTCQDISVILGLVGAIATVPTTLTLPGLYMSRLCDPQDRATKIEGWAGVVIGTVLMVLCVYGTLEGAST